MVQSRHSATLCTWFLGMVCTTLDWTACHNGSADQQWYQPRGGTTDAMAARCTVVDRTVFPRSITSATTSTQLLSIHDNELHHLRVDCHPRDEHEFGRLRFKCDVRCDVCVSTRPFYEPKEISFLGRSIVASATSFIACEA